MQSVTEYLQSHQAEALETLKALLRIPSVSAITAHKPDVRRAAEFVLQQLASAGLTTELVETAGHPIVYAEWLRAENAPTVLIYGHYDVQPVDPLELWTSPPFEPVEKDGKLIARGACDDKGQIYMHFSAIEAHLAVNKTLPVNLKLVIEGEEEAGSARVGEIIQKHKALLDADVWLFCDGPVHQSRRQLIAFGARGSIGFDLTIYGPNRELHSGHYGNWAPNPAQMLMTLVASMRNDDGLTLIDGFGDGAMPLSALEKQAVADAPDIGVELARELSLGRTLGDGEKIEMLVNRPLLNLRGISSGAVGRAARNIVPSTATASFDIRLVKGIDGGVALRRVIKHVVGRGYHVVDKDPDAATLRAHPKVAKISSAEGGYNAVRASMDLPISKKVIAAVESVRGPAVKVPTMGGSLPMAVFEEMLQRPLIIVPIANHDNNQHSHDENIRIQNLWDGIETMAALLAM